MEQQNDHERQKLEADKLTLNRERLEFERKKRDESLFVKHFGSIFAAIIALVAALVSATQAYVAYGQRKLAEAQTVEKFIPHLLKPESRDLALTAMGPFVDRGLVTNLAGKFVATGTLETLSQQGTPEQQQSAQKELEVLSQKRTALIEQMFDKNNKQTRISATGKLIEQWTADQKTVSEVLDFATKHIDNNDGVYNSVVLLQSCKLDLLKAQGQELINFLETAKKKGKQTAEQVKRVESRLNSSGASSDL